MIFFTCVLVQINNKRVEPYLSEVTESYKPLKSIKSLKPLNVEDAEQVVQVKETPQKYGVEQKQVVQQEPKQEVVTETQDVLEPVPPSTNENKLIEYIAQYAGDQAKLYVDLAYKYGEIYLVEPLWLLAMMETESTFNSSAVSSEGALGLMQILPSTAVYLGLDNPNDLYYPRTSVELAAQYLNELSRQTGSLKMATVAYNQGIGNVERGTYRTAYYDKVLVKYRNLEALSR